MIWKILRHSEINKDDNHVHLILKKEVENSKDVINIDDILTYDKYKGQSLKVVANSQNICCIKVPKSFDTKYIKPGTLLFKK